MKNIAHANTLVIFGGEDAEEAAARKVAEVVGCATATATVGGVPVHAGTAYKAEGFALNTGKATSNTEVVIFECAPAAAGPLKVVARCDHHNPGDAGWGKGADQYWEASSLGQLCALLGAERSHELELVAAGDHCPADAYAGRCEGIDPVEFLDFRISRKVAFYANHPKLPSKTAEEIYAAIKAAQAKLAAAPLVDSVRDLREAGRIDELPEAALSTGEAYMAALPDTDRDRVPTGNIKIVLGGQHHPRGGQAVYGVGQLPPEPRRRRLWQPKSGLCRCGGEACVKTGNGRACAPVSDFLF